MPSAQAKEELRRMRIRAFKLWMMDHGYWAIILAYLLMLATVHD